MAFRFVENTRETVYLIIFPGRASLSGREKQEFIARKRQSFRHQIINGSSATVCVRQEAPLPIFYDLGVSFFFHIILANYAEDRHEKVVGQRFRWNTLDLLMPGDFFKIPNDRLNRAKPIALRNSVRIAFVILPLRYRGCCCWNFSRFNLGLFRRFIYFPVSVLLRIFRLVEN